MRLSAFRLRISLSFVLSVLIAGQKARSAVFNLKAPAIHAEALLARASTGVRARQLSMDHRVKRGGDESETVAWHSSGAQTRRENGFLVLHDGSGFA
ncbi:MAG TPA: hypothetical protein VGH47_11570 [Xanthobacteraceae bacterium]